MKSVGFAFIYRKVWTKMAKEMWAASIFIAVLLLFILYVYVKSLRSYRNKEHNRFNENLYFYRKTLYVLYLSMIAIFWLLQLFTIKDWQTLLILAGVIVFIDIFIFSTPTITKIWKTEFQAYDPLKIYIQENSFMEEKQRDKLNYVSQLIQMAPIIKEEIKEMELPFHESLGIYLNYYAETFGLQLHIYQIARTSEASRSVNQRYEDFIKIIHIIKQTHTLDWESMLDNVDMLSSDYNYPEKFIVNMLWNGEIIALDREEKHGKGMAHLCPIFIEDQYTFILFIEEQHQRVYEMDALFLTNLAFLFCFLENLEVN